MQTFLTYWSCFRDQTPPRRARSDILDTVQTLKLKPPSCKVSPAMSSLQGFYSLAPPHKLGPLLEGTEMAVYKINSPLCANGITEDRSTAETAETNDIEKSIRRRQSVEKLAYKEKVSRWDQNQGVGQTRWIGVARILLTTAILRWMMRCSLLGSRRAPRTWRIRRVAPPPYGQQACGVCELMSLLGLF